ncbi:MAG TPA: Nif3-like dinuclear metal center hexameric protein, partial [Clostridiales bacterium]|nr:Nif3-like dinuclear metal center hexameric protein [Clostridiales bacterium]
MAIDSKELLNHLRFIAPRELEEDWDNGGFQINLRRPAVNKILVCLEITHKVIDEAVNAGVDFIVTHHPLLFHKLDVIDKRTMTGAYVIKLIREGISVYAAHTAFDSVFGGNNDYLAELLGLEKIRKLKYWTPFGDQDKIGRIGSWSEPLTLAAAAERV